MDLSQEHLIRGMSGLQTKIYWGNRMVLEKGLISETSVMSRLNMSQKLHAKAL